MHDTALHSVRVELPDPTRRAVTRTRYQPGDRLPNGAVVTLSERSPSGEVVLAKWERDWTVQWVTWIVAKNGQTVDGHYFEDQIDAWQACEPAFADFRRRLAGRAS